MSIYHPAEVARIACDLFAPVTERREIVGSVRRGKPDPHDAELLVIPSIARTTSTDLFGREQVFESVSLVELAVADMFASGEWALDSANVKDGPKYKRLLHVPSGIGLDLFITTSEAWGVQMVIRTGPSEFSKALVSLALGLKMHVVDGRLHKHEKLTIWNKKRELEAIPCAKGDACPLVVPTPDEASFFAALGVPWMEPAARSAARVPGVPVMR